MNTIMEKLVHYATLAPSGHNTQPWKFSIEGPVIGIHPDFTRRLPVVDPDDHALYISLGCALENLLIAAHHLGFRTAVDMTALDKTDGKILVQVEEAEVNGDKVLFDAITRRQSTRRSYNGKAVPDADLDKLRRTARWEDVGFRIFTDPEEIERLVDFVMEANRLQFGNPAFVEELLSWIRFSPGKARQKGDGLNSRSMGAPPVPQWLGRWIMKFVSPEGEAKKSAEAIRSSAGLMMFTAAHATRHCWVQVGRSFERVALTATSLDIKHAHVNMPCEVPGVRQKMAAHLGFSSEQPLLLLRFGYGQEMPPSFRRPVRDILAPALGSYLAF